MIDGLEAIGTGLFYTFLVATIFYGLMLAALELEHNRRARLDARLDREAFEQLENDW